MKVEKGFWFFLLGGLLTFVGGFVIGMTGYENGLEKKHQKKLKKKELEKKAK